MALRGVISRASKLTRAEWSACIDELPHLLQHNLEVREIDNPFKPGTKAVVAPPPGLARLFDEGVAVGAIEPGDDFDQDGELLVWAPEGEVANIRARRVSGIVSRHLNAELQWIEDP